MFHVYILKSVENNRYYVGQTGSLEKRLADHNLGLCRSTKKWLPWRLIYKEVFLSRADAMKRERQIKNYKGGIAFKKIVSN